MLVYIVFQSHDMMGLSFLGMFLVQTLFLVNLCHCSSYKIFLTSFLMDVLTVGYDRSCVACYLAACLVQGYS